MERIAMDNRNYLTNALAILRDHPHGPDYAASETPDSRMAELLRPHDWSETAQLPTVLGREFQEALGAYLTMIGAREFLPQTLVTATPYGETDPTALRRLLIDAADAALRADRA